MAKDTKQTESCVGVVETRHLKLELPEGGFRLEKGGVLPEIEVAYECCGRETPDRSNVVFVCHALTGDAHVAGIRQGETEPSGWWEGMVGPGKGIDTDRYRVVCANILGGCQGTTGPKSVDPRTGAPYGSRFPQITVSDMVEVHRLLLRQLGIGHLAVLVGGSFGGMQVLDWLIRHPDEADKAMVIASAACLTTQALAFDIVGRNSIVKDPKWNGGDYYGGDDQPDAGLSSARKIAHITYLSQELMEDKFGREKRPEWLQKAADAPDFRKKMERNFATFFQIESYLKHQGEKFVQRFDANSYLHISLAMDEFDADEKYGGLKKAFEPLAARVLVVSLSGDWLFNADQAQEIVQALVRDRKRVSYCHLNAPAGHDAFLTHICDLKRVIRAFIEPDDEDGGRPFLDWQLRHYDRVVKLVPPGSRVIDLGCGYGTLLNILACKRGCSGFGVEYDVERVIPAIASGCDVIMDDLDGGLKTLPEDEAVADVALLSETLQTIRRPRSLMTRILRVAREFVVAFPNFGCWIVPFCLLFKRRMPKGKQLPFEWYDTPNIHLFTLRDFLDLCRDQGLRVLELHAISRGIAERFLRLFGFKTLGSSRIIARLTREGGKEG